MKTISWILVIVAVIVMIIGLVDGLVAGKFFGVKHLVNYCHLANTFLLFAICSKFICTWKKKE
ncbi:MAG: hypothetical protein KAW88_09945 [Candidatus Cloacimonetes bacterium]|nr:hypothetical protein [Candidatus Cloacimonadota bacterium]